MKNYWELLNAIEKGLGEIPLDCHSFTDVPESLQSDLIQFVNTEELKPLYQKLLTEWEVLCHFDYPDRVYESFCAAKDLLSLKYDGLSELEQSRLKFGLSLMVHEWTSDTEFSNRVDPTILNKEDFDFQDLNKLVNTAFSMWARVEFPPRIIMLLFLIYSRLDATMLFVTFRNDLPWLIYCLKKQFPIPNFNAHLPEAVSEMLDFTKCIRNRDLSLEVRTGAAVSLRDMLNHCLLDKDLDDLTDIFRYYPSNIILKYNATRVILFLESMRKQFLNTDEE